MQQVASCQWQDPIAAVVPFVVADVEGVVTVEVFLEPEPMLGESLLTRWVSFVPDLLGTWAFGLVEQNLGMNVEPSPIVVISD